MSHFIDNRDLPIYRAFIEREALDFNMLDPSYYEDHINKQVKNLIRFLTASGEYDFDGFHSISFTSPSGRAVTLFPSRYGRALTLSIDLPSQVTGHIGYELLIEE